MPLYEYKAYGNDGKTTTGLVDAPSKNSAFSKLKRQGLFPIEMTEETTSGIQKKISASDLIFAIDQLSTLLRANIPLPEALGSLFEQIENRDLKKAFARIKVHIEEGESFASALTVERIFPPILVKMIEAGESVGAIDVILERFTGFMEKEQEFREKVTSSLIYPVMIVIASITLIFFMLTYIAPTLVDVFKSFNQQLPMPTQILLAIGNFLRNNSIFIGILVAGAITAYIRVLPRSYKDSIKMNIPFFGSIHKDVQISRWAKTLSMLHSGGVNLVKALASSREIVENSLIAEELKRAEDLIQKGDTLGASLSRVNHIPQLVVQMAKTGEKSGELEKLLNTVAVFYEKEVEKRLSMFFKFLEPLMILFLGVVVGFVVMAALLPIFEINKMIK